MANYLGNTAQGAAGGAGAGSSFGPYGAAIGAVAGAGASAYGTLLQSQQADSDYARAMQAWQAEKERQARMDIEARQQQTMQNGLAGGQYARSLSNDIQAPYLNYARGLGL